MNQSAILRPSQMNHHRQLKVFETRHYITKAVTNFIILELPSGYVTVNFTFATFTL